MVKPSNVSPLIGDMDRTVQAYRSGYDISYAKNMIIRNNGILEARYLISRGVRFSGRDLFQTYEVGNSSLARVMLDGHTPPNGEKYEIPLHWVCANGDSQGFHDLIAKQADINIPDGHGMTPLHFAAQAGNAEFVSILLRLGANKLAADMEGNIPRHYANGECLRLLR